MTKRLPRLSQQQKEAIAYGIAQAYKREYPAMYNSHVTMNTIEVLQKLGWQFRKIVMTLRHCQLYTFDEQAIAKYEESEPQ